jgi:mitochondrial translocator assembly and maintenance protein 41
MSPSLIITKESLFVGTTSKIIVSSKDVAAKCVKRGLRRLVMTSSARQALSGLIATGGLNATKYLGRKMSKAWRSRIS